MTATFASIEATARALPAGRMGEFADRVRCKIDSAYQNAHETIHLEKAASEADFDGLALASLGSILSCCGESDVCDWFWNNGVKF